MPAHIALLNPAIIKLGNNVEALDNLKINA